MKKIIYKLILILLFFTLLCSCENEPIFSTIRQEVELTDESVMAGNTYAIVEGKGYLFAVNGKIWRKPSDNIGERFQEIEKPVSSGVLAQNVACDNEYVYVLFTDTSSIYFSPIQETLEWNLVSVGDEYVIQIIDNYGIASENSKNAYCVTENGIFLLSGNTLGAKVTTGIETLTDIDVSEAKHCYHIDSGDYFFGTNSCTSNRKDMLYYADEDIIYYGTDGINWTPVSVSIGEPKSLEYYSYNQDEYLYVGTSSGLMIVDVEAGIPIADIDMDPGTNADSSFGSYIIKYIFSLPYNSGNVFVASYFQTTTEYNKLWGYSPSTAKWDLE